MAAESITVPSTSQLLHFALTPEGTLTDHLVVAFKVTGETATPIYWPAIPKGAKLMTERVGEGWHLDGKTARSPAELAQKLREHVQ